MFNVIGHAVGAAVPYIGGAILRRVAKHAAPIIVKEINHIAKTRGSNYRILSSMTKLRRKMMKEREESLYYTPEEIQQMRYHQQQNRQRQAHFQHQQYRHNEARRQAEARARWEQTVKENEDRYRRQQEMVSNPRQQSPITPQQTQRMERQASQVRGAQYGGRKLIPQTGSFHPPQYTLQVGPSPPQVPDALPLEQPITVDVVPRAQANDLPALLRNVAQADPNDYIQPNEIPPPLDEPGEERSMDLDEPSETIFRQWQPPPSSTKLDLTNISNINKRKAGGPPVKNLKPGTRFLARNLRRSKGTPSKKIWFENWTGKRPEKNPTRGEIDLEAESEGEEEEGDPEYYKWVSQYIDDYQKLNPSLTPTEEDIAKAWIEKNPEGYIADDVTVTSKMTPEERTALDQVKTSLGSRLKGVLGPSTKTLRKPKEQSFAQKLRGGFGIIP